jgi:hypothetical protein
MPSQKKLSAPLVKSRQEFLLSWSVSHDSTADQAWKISRCQFNAGSWLAAIPSLKKFKCTSNVFKIMLQLHLGLPLGVAGSVSECQGCKASEDILSLRNGRHWTTRCNKAWRNKTHNKLRDEIEAMFTQGLGATPTMSKAGTTSSEVTIRSNRQTSSDMVMAETNLI